MKPLTNFERHLLSQPVRSLALPELKNPSDIDLFERAAKVGYGDPNFCERSEGNLQALCMVLDVLPSSRKERMQRIEVK
jgi:hypothetical protein